MSPTRRTDCEGFHRRDFLKLGSAGLLGLGFADLLRLEARASAGTRAKAKSVIMVWLAGGPATKLSPSMAAGSAGVYFDTHISGDGARVAFRADTDGNETNELYSVPIAGGAATPLTGPVVPGGETSFVFGISPDSARVIFQGELTTDGVTELYSVPIAGGMRAKLNDPLVANGDVRSLYFVSPDSQQIVYQADGDTDEVIELYRVPIAGGDVEKLSGPMVAGGDLRVNSPRITADGLRVLYAADQETDEQIELFATFDESLLPATGAYLPVVIAP